MIIALIPAYPIKDTMKQNDTHFLQQWQDHGSFPSIYDKITDLIVKNCTVPKILDLGCGHGLLGQSLTRKMAGCYVLGVDSNADFIDQAKFASIHIELQHVHVHKDNINTLAVQCQLLGIKTIVARRSFPEIFGDDPQDLSLFAATMKAYGIDQIFLQGQISVPNPKTQLFNAAQEVRWIKAHYEPRITMGECVYLQARP